MASNVEVWMSSGNVIEVEVLNDDVATGMSASLRQGYWAVLNKWREKLGPGAAWGPWHDMTDDNIVINGKAVETIRGNIYDPPDF